MREFKTKVGSVRYYHDGGGYIVETVFYGCTHNRRYQTTEAANIEYRRQEKKLRKETRELDEKLKKIS